MRIIFAGTPEFAAAALAALSAAGHEICLVLTQPDRPAGRGMAMQASPVKRLAERLGIPVRQPLRLKDEEIQQAIREVSADVMVVAAYGLILPQAVLDMPRLGCLNIHASLLPRWRGAAPIQRAILAGDSETGICIMRMEAGLDTGPVLKQAVTPIGVDETAGHLHDRLAGMGADLIVSALDELERLPVLMQPADGVSYAAKIEKSEAIIHWERRAVDLDRQIRAFNPFPGAQAKLDGVLIKLWAAAPVAGQGAAGEILAIDRQGIVIACGEGALRVTELQKAGGKRLPAAQFMAGNPLTAGQRFT